MNPYEILGVKKNARPQTIKRAYRKRAMETHPDRQGDAAEFRNVQRAWDVLSDLAKKAEYDRTGQMPSDAPDNAKAKRMGVVTVVFQSVVGALLNSGQNPAECDLAKLMREAVQRRVNQLASDRRQPEKTAALFRDLLGRFSASEGENDMEPLVALELAGIEAAIRKIDEETAMLKAVQLEIARFAFRAKASSKEPGVFLAQNMTITLNRTAP